MTTNGQIPATRNDAWGFWGTMNERANTAWPLAIAAISNATGGSLESVRIFLDSRHGRHFADDVQNGLDRGQTLQGWGGRSDAKPARTTASRAGCPTSRAS